MTRRLALRVDDALGLAGLHASLRYRCPDGELSAPLFDALKDAAQIAAMLGLPSDTAFRAGDVFDFDVVVDPKTCRKETP